MIRHRAFKLLKSVFKKLRAVVKVYCGIKIRTIVFVFKARTVRSKAFSRHGGVRTETHLSTICHWSFYVSDTAFRQKFLSS
jgi:hypothetical protein